MLSTPSLVQLFKAGNGSGSPLPREERIPIAPSLEQLNAPAAHPSPLLSIDRLAKTEEEPPSQQNAANVPPSPRIGAPSSRATRRPPRFTPSRCSALQGSPAGRTVAVRGLVRISRQGRDELDRGTRPCTARPYHHSPAKKSGLRC